MSLNELKCLPEYAEFIDPGVRKVKFDEKALEANLEGILPVREWIPATSRFIRFSISKLRRRSPSPHLNALEDDLLDVVKECSDADGIMKEFEDEKREARQRLRLHALKRNHDSKAQLEHFEPCLKRMMKSESTHNTEGTESTDDMDGIGDSFPLNLRNYRKEMRDFSSRQEALESSLKSLNSMMGALTTCQVQMKEVLEIFTEESSDDSGADSEAGGGDGSFDFKSFLGSEVIRSGSDCVNQLVEERSELGARFLGPLTIQFEDVRSLAEGVMGRVVILKRYTAVWLEQQRSINELNRLQDLSGSETSAAKIAAIDRRLAAKNVELDGLMQGELEIRSEWLARNETVSKQLAAWESASDAFLLEEINK